MIEQWNILFENHQNPCFVACRKTFKILYHNNKILDLLKIDYDVVDKDFFELVKFAELEIEAKKFDWENEKIIKSKVFSKKTDVTFSVRGVLIEHGTAIFCEAFFLEEDLNQSLKFEDAMTQCVQIYNEADDAKHDLMELLCNFYGSEGAYVYRFNRDENVLHCVTQWTEDPNYCIKEDTISDIDITSLLPWLEKDSVNGFVTVNTEFDNFDHSSNYAKALDRFNIRNIVICNIENSEHEIVGIVGLSNLKHYDNFLDRRLMTTIAKFVAQDVITKGESDERLFQLHHQDTLTGLYNRARYSRKTEHFFNNPIKSMGVISVNVNGLKEVNDNAGISAGDELIKNSAQVLQNHFKFEIYRVSGDEFIGLAPEIAESDFEDAVMTMHTKLKSENNNDFSFGHAWGSGNIDISKLVMEAETIMYINKQEYYSNSKREFDSVKDSVLSELLGFLADGEFMIYLQPQVYLKDGTLYGAEALIRRFDKKNQKMVFPDQFISYYEQKSLIRHIDIFVLEQVCSLLTKWKEEGKPQLPISVNLSRVTLQEYGIVDTIAKICDRYGVDRDLLVIEVTERVGLIENNVASSLVMDFKDRGFKISLDDFGCAYSNIVTLAQIEVDEVKLDKSLVDYVTTNRKNNILVENVLRMCNDLDNISTLAEGIETQEQANLLRNLGCHLGQGYYYSRPIPVDEFYTKFVDRETTFIFNKQ